MTSRAETRLQRYANKMPAAQKMRCSVAAVEFQLDANVGMIVRAAACFGAAAVHVIGHVPPRVVLRGLSGSTSDLVEIIQHKTPSDFIRATRGSSLISLELRAGSIPISDFEFDACADTIIVAGHEECGVPEEIFMASEAVVHIPMPGFGFCLNTALSAHVALYEYTRQIRERA